jgi:hypothetical protein
LKLITLIVAIGLSFVFTKANAAVHAGDITYKWLYGYTYQVKYTIYTDNVPADNYCDISPSCSQAGVIILRSNGPSSSGPCSPGLDGIIVPGSNYKMNEYVTTHSFPGPGNYMFCLEVPNRSAGVINIPNSVNQTFNILSSLNIPLFGSGKNTSTVFGNLPIASGCSNNGCYTYNPLATDADGDSLSYEIDMCKGNSGIVPGYAYPSAGAGGTFSIDPVIGTLSWCNPQYNGIYNVVIRIKEWRKDDDGNYSLIGFVERDTEFSMSTCTDVNERTSTKNDISVYPNPANLAATIQLPGKGNYAIKLFDVAGKLILNNNCTNNNTYDLNLENINPGIYFLEITGSDHSTITKKIIKQ